MSGILDRKESLDETLEASCCHCLIHCPQEPWFLSFEDSSIVETNLAPFAERVALSVGHIIALVLTLVVLHRGRGIDKAKDIPQASLPLGHEESQLATTVATLKQLSGTAMLICLRSLRIICLARTAISVYREPVHLMLLMGGHIVLCITCLVSIPSFLDAKDGLSTSLSGWLMLVHFCTMIYANETFEMRKRKLTQIRRREAALSLEDGKGSAASEPKLPCSLFLRMWIEVGRAAGDERDEAARA